MSVKYVEAVQKESCGRCVPCRIGSKVILDILKGVAEGRGKKEDLERIPAIAAGIKDGSKCQIGQTGFVPGLQALRFPGDRLGDV